MKYTLFLIFCIILFTGCTNKTIQIDKNSDKIENSCAKENLTCLRKSLKSYLIQKPNKKAKEYTKLLLKKEDAEELFYFIWDMDDKGLLAPKVALEFYELIGDAGYDEAYYEMAWINYRKLRDYKNAHKYLHKAIKTNNVNAFFMLASLYVKGLGVKKDIQKAIYYYKKSGLKAAKEEIELLKEKQND